MGIINIYNTVSNEHTVENKNGKLKDILPDLNFSKAIILKAGSKVDADYNVTDDDVVYIRLTPSAASTVAAVVLGTAVIAGAGYTIGKIFYNFKDSKYQKMLEKAQRDSKNLAQQVQQLPFIKGSKNQSALGNSVQFVMGDVFNTPYKINDGSYIIHNSDYGDKGIVYGDAQFYNVALSLGYGNQKIKDIKLRSDTLIKNDAGITSGIHRFYLNNDSSGLECILEVRQAGEDFITPEFKNKIISTLDGNEIKHDYGQPAEELVRTLPDYARSVDVCIQFNGLGQYDSEAGTWRPLDVGVYAYWTNVENPTEADWHSFKFEGSIADHFEENTNKILRYVAHKDFTAEECYGKNIKIRLMRSEKKQSNAREDCYLLYYQSEIYDNAKSTPSNLVTCSAIEDELKDTARFGVKLVSNDNTKDILDEFHAYVCGLARTWNGFSWSTEKTETRNPAAWVLEILTSPVHKHSKFSDNEIDLDSLGRLYEYCEENEFYTDGILTQGIKKRDLISTILTSVNSTMIINDDGKFEFVIDDIEETPVALINSENISGITYAKELTRQPDGLKVTFVNRDSWLVDTFYAMLNNKQRTQDDALIETTFDYVTTHKHAYKLAQRMMKQQILQPREITVDVGREGDYYPLYSTVMLQYNTFRQGLNSSTIAGLNIENNKIVSVTLSDAVVFERGKNYGLIIQAQNSEASIHYYKTVKGTEKTRELKFDEPIDYIDSPLIIGNICSFGELGENNSFDKITNVMKITGIRAKENGYSLVLRDYNPAIYTAGEIPEFKSNLTEPPKPVKEIPFIEKLEGEPGANGYSSYTLQLYKRYADIPSLPTGTLTYTFNPPSLQGDLGGWSQSMPEIDEDNNPLYETHVTIVNQNNTVQITAEDFTEPVIVLKESNITIADIQEMINKVTPPPTVEADVTFFGVMVNEQGINPKDQSITTEIHVRQIEEELGFEFGDIQLPEGFEYKVEQNKIKITCKKDTFVKSGSIIIPVRYRAYKANVAYVNNEDGNVYYIGSGNVLGNFDDISQLPANPEDDVIINWVGEDTAMSRASDNTFEKNTAYQFVAGKWKKFDATPYGYYVYESNYTVSNIGIGYTNVKGFRYLNSITSIENIPTDIVFGDWFTWNGEDTDSDVVEGGVFNQCCIYAWNGDKWEIDQTTEHNTTALFDILKIAESKLSENNTTAQSFLDRLCANQAFVKTLVVTGSAFINELQALNIYANQITVAKNEAIASVESNLGVDTLEDKTIIDGGKIKTNLIDTDEIKAKQGFFDNIQVTGVVDAIHIGQSIYAENCDEFLSQMKALLDDKWHTFIGEKDVLCSGYALFQTKYNKVTISINDVYKASTGYIVSGEIVGSNNEGDSSINAEYFGEFPNKDNIFKYYGDLCIKSSSEGSSSNYFGINSISTLQQIYNINKIKLIAIKLNL